MQSEQDVNLKEYREFIEKIAKVEYQKLAAAHVIEYLELVNIATHTLYNLFKESPPSQFNNSYLATAIKWSIRNEIRRRYKWYSQKNTASEHEHEDLREAVYKTILSIDEITTSEVPTQIKDDGKNPEEFLEFFELKKEIIEEIKSLPQRERDLIESKFFKEKKLKEISDEFNLSPSRASRIIQSGLDKIKKRMSQRELS